MIDSDYVQSLANDAEKRPGHLQSLEKYFLGSKRRLEELEDRVHRLADRLYGPEGEVAAAERNQQLKPQAPLLHRIEELAGEQDTAINRIGVALGRLERL